MIQHPVVHLTDNYRKDEESNNYKLLTLGHLEHIDILNNLSKIELARDIDEASGFTLDKTGKNVLELRNDRNDEAFRKAIKIKIRGSLSSGTIEDINVIADILFGDSFQFITEIWCDETFNNEPAGIALVLKLKEASLANKNLYHYINDIVMSVKAGGVRLCSKVSFNISLESKLFINPYISQLKSRVTISNNDASGIVETKMFADQYLCQLRENIMIISTNASGFANSRIYCKSMNIQYYRLFIS